MEYSSTWEWRSGSREPNRDSLCLQQVRIRRGTALLAAVCDGDGGEGARASGYLIEQLTDWFYREGLAFARLGREKKMAQSLTALLAQADGRLFSYGRKRGVCLWTTVCALVLWRSRFLLAQAGDGRAYRLSPRRGFLRGCGLLPRCILLLPQSGGEDGGIRLRGGRARERDGFLLCSSGFCGEERPRQIAALFADSFRNGADREAPARTLREAASACVRAGSRDDVSAVWIRCEGRR